MKIKIICFFLLTLFVLSSVVFADMSSPMIQVFKAEICNPFGAIIYDVDYKDGNWTIIENGQLEYGEVYTVRHNRSINGEEYAALYKDTLEMNGYSSDEFVGYVLYKDINPIKDNLKLEDFQLSENKEKLKVIAAEGVTMYEWPSFAYTEIAKLPYGTTIEGYSQDFSGWYYIQYNGVNGWVCSLNKTIGRKENSASWESFMTRWKEIEMKDKEGNVIGKLPINTVIQSENYWFTDLWSKQIYVTYNGISGYISEFEVAYRLILNDYMKDLTKDYSINYEGAKMICTDGTILDIPVGTKIEFSQYGDTGYHDEGGWSLINYQGKEGWVYCDFYYKPDNNSEEQKRIINDIINTAVEESKGNFVEDKAEIIRQEVSENVLSGENYEKPQVMENNVKTNVPMTPTQLILICILCAVIASLTTTVVIILINKKKN